MIMKQKGCIFMTISLNDPAVIIYQLVNDYSKL